MDGGEYAEMIEIPVSTCEMVVLPKKRKKKNLRKRVIDKVNKNLESSERSATAEQNAEVEEKPIKKRFSFDIISAQVIAIFVLVVAILATNIFWEDSGINNLLKGAFNKTEEPVDERTYLSFEAYAPSKEGEIGLEAGVMTIESEGAIYPPCTGVIADISEVDGKYTITINHSDMFKTIIKNADYAYFDVGETVYQAIPVSYSALGGVEVLMYNDNSLLTSYVITDGMVVWQN